ncbi:MAG: hypothetical protein AAF848_07620 [Pseudomonadota bacterium]
MTFLLSIIASWIGATLTLSRASASGVYLGAMLGLLGGIGVGLVLTAIAMPGPDLGSLLVTLFAGAGTGAMMAVGARAIGADRLP